MKQPLDEGRWSQALGAGSAGLWIRHQRSGGCAAGGANSHAIFIGNDFKERQLKIVSKIVAQGKLILQEKIRT
jgi:hypothetical protein